MVLPTLIAFVYGCLIGSFLNVCIYRLPRNESIVRPRSKCPRCGTMVAWYDNVPILSWLLLRAKCRHCGQPISWQYPLLELAVGIIWGATTWIMGISFETISAAAFLSLLLAILITDARHYIIPDELSLGGLGIGLVLSLVTDIGLVQSLIGAAVGFGVLWSVKAAGDLALKKGWIGGAEIRETLGEDEPLTAMGGGDLKMMAMVGAFLGWRGVLLTIFLGALAGTVIYLPFLFREKKPLVPFGIYLALGGFITLVAGSRLVAWYAAWLRP
jgi:leader peptidase (prepilin peptidase)/N-methyltransferase